MTSETRPLDPATRKKLTQHVQRLTEIFKVQATLATTTETAERKNYAEDYPSGYLLTTCLSGLADELNALLVAEHAFADAVLDGDANAADQALETIDALEVKVEKTLDVLEQAADALPCEG